MSDGQFKILLSFQCRMVVACECNWHDFFWICLCLCFLSGLLSSTIEQMARSKLPSASKHYSRFSR